MIRRRPNFFIVGAPKCGTTALSEYLRTHPNVFMSVPKEPHYFARDFSPLVYHYAQTLPEYLALFRDAAPEHAAVGEASVWYLYSSVAIDGIRQFDPAARIIAMVRNPIDMAQSLHAQLLSDTRETEPRFRRAWEMQDERRQGRKLPLSIDVPAFLLYGEICSLGRQVNRLLATCDRRQVMVVVFDDFIRSPGSVYADTLAFLGLEHDGRTEFPVTNPRTEPSHPWLARLNKTVIRLGRFRRLTSAVKQVKATVGLSGRRIVGIDPTRLVRIAPRPPLDPEFRAELAEAFRTEVEMLGDLIGRDLRHWLKPQGNPS